MEATARLQPVTATGLRSPGMALWMLFTRIPAMTRLRMAPDAARSKSKLMDLLPAG